MTMDDHRLDLEFAYTPWGSSCQDPYGLDPHGFMVQCRRPGGHDGGHAAGFGDGRVRW